MSRYDRNYSIAQRGFAVVLGAACHLAFLAGVGSMIAGLYSGLRIGRGPFSGGQAALFDLLLVLQFAIVHSLLLSRPGRAWLERMTPLRLGRDLATTTYALVASLQLVLTFAAWSPIGVASWEPHGPLRAVVTVAYAGSWLLLLKAMSDAGLSVQTGLLGWSAVARGRAPSFPRFGIRGTFRYVRQPVYIAFALTLWTGPVWTLDHLMLALGWTLYCVLGPQLKERRYLRAYGDRFERYRALVPYWIPRSRAQDMAVLAEPAE
jgi:protein-S-isoprenylcysteine O-methyltransferase Ste14